MNSQLEEGKIHKEEEETQKMEIIFEHSGNTRNKNEREGNKRKRENVKGAKEYS